MIYLTCTLAITTLSMVLTVLVLNVYGITDRPVPDWTRRFILVHLARSLGMCRTARAYQVVAYQPATGHAYQPTGHAYQATSHAYQGINGSGRKRPARLRFFRHSLLATTSDPDESASIIEMRTQASSTTSVDLMREVTSTTSTTFDAPVLVRSAMFDTPTVVRRPVNEYGSSGMTLVAPSGAELKKDKCPTDYAKDWKRVAEICDRFFFWLFLLIIVLSTIVLFHPLLYSHHPSID